MAKAQASKKATARKGKSKATTLRKTVDTSHRHDRFGADAAHKATDRAAERETKAADAAVARLRKKETAKAKEISGRRDRRAKVTATKAAIKALDSTAKEINVRLDKAKQSADKSIDHRLAAALLLADAKTNAAKAGVIFKNWAAKHITQGWETARKLAVIGAADNPREALEGVRAANKEANKKLRGKTAASRDTPAPKGKAEPAGQVAMRGLGGMKTDEKRALLSGEASNLGMKMVDKDTPASKGTPGKLNNANTARQAFNSMKASEKMTFLNWAVMQVGATIDFDTAPGPTEEQEIPANLKR